MKYLQIAEGEVNSYAEIDDEIREAVLEGDCDIFKFEKGEFFRLVVGSEEEGYTDSWELV